VASVRSSAEVPRFACGIRRPAATRATLLSDTVELADDRAGIEFCRGAIAAGDLDACRRRLQDARLPDRARAEIYCRLGEALFYRQEQSAAVECARAAFALSADDERVADFCAWLFSNCRRYGEAAAAYERLLQGRPQWAAGHRHASGAFAAAGQLDRAIFHGLRACEIEPDMFELAFHAGSLLEAAGRHADAVGQFARAARIDPVNADALRRLSAAAASLGQPQKAIEFALRALELAPEDRDNALHAAELLLRSARHDEAAAILRRSLAGQPQQNVAWRLLSAAEMLRSRLPEALAAIDQALALAPDIVDYHLHRGNILYRLGELDAAAAAFGRAAALDPAAPDARRSQLTAYFDAGRYREAVAAGSELIRAAPDNEEYARALSQALNRWLDAVDCDYLVLDEAASRLERQPPRARGFCDAAITQWRVIYALIVRETRTRFGDSVLGYGWALIEPILHIATLSLAFAVLMRGRPPIGTQFFIFYYTGLIPYHIFVHASSSMTYAVTSNGSLLQLPLVKTTDVIVARGILELVTDLLVAVLILAGFLAVGIGHLPNDLAGVASSITVIWLFACGCGFINAVLNAACKSWDKIWNQVTRILYFCSGIFYVPGMMPDWIRDILWWNPMLHGVDWFRASFFGDYEPFWLDRSYLAITAGLTLLAGLALERGLRRQLYEPA
jgi:ABC-type polysaccharide/polyol phosphate export permease/lipopolysaccharide biosynthesis regulator YciM